MSKTEHPYAQVLRWIADGETVECCYGEGGVYGPCETEGLLGNIARGAAVKPNFFRPKPRTININGHEYALSDQGLAEALHEVNLIFKEAGYAKGA